MEYYVALAPEFSISPAEFAAAWNATDAARQLAEARVDATAPQGFPLDPAMLQQGALILIGFAGGIAADVLKDTIKERLKSLIARKFPTTPPPAVEVVIVDQFGAPLVVVKKSV